MKHLPFPTLLILCALFTSSVFAQEKSGTSEPTNAKEAGKKKTPKNVDANVAYKELVAKLPPEQQVWEVLLQDNLGNFYLPIHKSQKLKGHSNAWDYVEDNPKLPRVLLIGDSVSRAYTQGVRKALKGKANLHRAPANCGPTARGIEKIDIWLGDGKWDIIHFNFGIHDRNTPLADYTQRLEKLIARMKKTGAKLIWASTTPIPDVEKTKQTAASIVERNLAAAAIMKENKILIDDLFKFITPHLDTARIPNDVHYNAVGYQLIAEQVAKFIEKNLK